MTRWIRNLRGRERGGLAGAEHRLSLVEAAPVVDQIAGDRARADRDWPKAAVHYRRHVADRPDDGAIWMQLGHASKEAGDLDGAEAAYRTAENLLPGDPDVPLQIGHLLKLRGRGREAAAAYAAALKLLPSSDAYGELVHLGQGALANRLTEGGATRGVPTLFLDISDLLSFLRLHKMPSGIQRVQLGILETMLDRGRGPAERPVEFVAVRYNDVAARKLRRAALAAILDALRSDDFDHGRVRSTIDDALATAMPVRPGRGDSFVLLGAFWDRVDNASLLNAMRREGASIGVYVYDIIPITHPEFCNHQLVIDFTCDFCEMLRLTDFTLAISEFSAAQVRSFAEVNGLPEIPMAVVPLAHSLTGRAASPGDEPDWTGEIADLRGREFVLCVCTIEPRKNHSYLFDVWKALKAEGIAVPLLVFVGRRGWNVDDLFAQLHNSDWLGGTIRVLHDLSDHQLATLYRRCMFTAFPSVVEGWGLPVGESLTNGRLCVSSNASSMPEVGGGCVAYVDPLNVRDGVAVFRELILDRSRIAEWEGRIKATFKPRAWTDVSNDLLEAVARLGFAPRRVESEVVAELKSGQVVDVARFARGMSLRPVRDYVALERLALGESFYAAERFGAWMKGRAGTLRFQTGLPAERGILLYLKLRGAPNLDGGEVSVSGSVRPCTRPIEANRIVVMRLKGAVDGAGLIDLRLRFAGQCRSHEPDQRDFCMGLVAFGFADVEDALARAELLECMLVDQSELERC